MEIKHLYILYRRVLMDMIWRTPWPSMESLPLYVLTCIYTTQALFMMICMMGWIIWNAWNYSSQRHTSHGTILYTYHVTNQLYISFTMLKTHQHKICPYKINMSGCWNLNWSTSYSAKTTSKWSEVFRASIIASQ